MRNNCFKNKLSEKINNFDDGGIVKNIIIFGLQATMIFSAFAMDMDSVAPMYNFYSDFCPHQQQLFGGEIDNMWPDGSIFPVNQDKLRSVVRNNGKVGKLDKSSGRVSKKRSGHAKKLSLQKAKDELNMRIISRDFEGTCDILEHAGLKKSSLLAARLIGVKDHSIQSVAQFYEGLTEIPLNTIQMAENFADCGRNALFLKDCKQQKNYGIILDI